MKPFIQNFRGNFKWAYKIIIIGLTSIVGTGTNSLIIYFEKLLISFYFRRKYVTQKMSVIKKVGRCTHFTFFDEL